MNTKLHLIITLFFNIVIFNSFSQLQVTQGNTAEFYVQSIFGGDGVEISNVKYTGIEMYQIGEFSNGNSTNIGLDMGVIMSTGLVTSAIGPNDEYEADEIIDELDVIDPDLAMLLPNEWSQDQYDASILEFDFVADGNKIEFNYVFASEEYPEFVLSEFNDVFGLFISGPGINGTFTNNAMNIATIPGNNGEVAINNVNNGPDGLGFNASNPQYFKDNGTGSNPAGTTIRYNGFTVPLAAEADVIPCETYHIKIAITDVGDDWLDSGIFLEGNSFSSDPLISQSDYTAPCNETMIQPFVNGTGDFTWYTEEIGGTILGTSTDNNPSTAFNVLDLAQVTGVQPNKVYTVYVGSPALTCRKKINIPEACLPLCNLSEVSLQTPEGTSLDTIETCNLDQELQTSVTRVIENGDDFEYEFLYDDGLGGDFKSTGLPSSLSTITANSNGNYVVRVTDPMSPSTCFKTDTLYFVKSDTPSVTIDYSKKQVCEGENVSFVALPVNEDIPPKYEWRINDLIQPETSSFINRNDLSNNDIVTVKLLTQNACLSNPINSNITPIEVVSKPVSMILPGNISICETDEKTLSSSNLISGSTYTWLQNDEIQDSGSELNEITISEINQSGVWTLVVDNGICPAVTSPPVNVKVDENPLLSIIQEPSSDDQVKLVGTSSVGTTSWSPSANLSSSSDLITVFDGSSSPLMNNITLTSVNGECKEQTTTTIVISADIAAPNIFTPNGDGENDTFVIQGMESRRDASVIIFNRWGVKIYETKDYMVNEWDGGDVPDGVYYFLVQTVNENESDFTGVIHVVR